MDNYENLMNEITTNDSNGDIDNNYGYGQERKDSKKILSRCGWYLSLITIAISLAQGIIIGLSDKYFAKFYESDWFELTVTAAGMLGVGVPLAFILMKRLPYTERGEVKKLSLRKFMEYFMICYAAMIYSNVVTVIINSIIAGIKGSEVINPLEDVISGSNIFVLILYVSILGPIAEELIFRKFLLDKLRRFGDVPAILISSLAFGLFHMNLSQVLYATAVGMVMAYVTIKTNTVRYSIVIHMMLNFIGSILSVLVTNSGNMIAYLLFIIFVFALVTAGTRVFVKNYKNIQLDKVERPLVKQMDYILNSGTIVFIILCMFMIVESVL